MSITIGRSEDILWNNLNYTSVISFKQKVSKYTKESENCKAVFFNLFHTILMLIHKIIFQTFFAPPNPRLHLGTASGTASTHIYTHFASFCRNSPTEAPPK